MAVMGCLLVVLVSGARAEEKQTGPYVGFGVGQGRYADSCTGILVSCHEGGLAGKGYIGYRFLPYLAAETGLTYFGKSRAQAAPIESDLEGWGIPINAVGILPLADDRWWLMAKAGGVYWNVRSSLSAQGEELAHSTDHGFSFTYGAGVQYNFTDRFSARAEYEVIHDALELGLTHSSDIRMWSIGLVWRF
jgi:opacity protein-like surface antigen